MDLSDLARFARRDWGMLGRMKAEHWKGVKKASGAGAALRAGEELRRQTRRLRPNWPTEQDRRRDLATHARVTASLRRVVSRHAR
jgi:hypothetical protein